jgi:DNA polymerase III alpha subunit
VVEAVGMESLADVAAITSLIRPGPRDMEMDMEYAHRKNGKPYESIPCLESIMEETYGVMTYQEQVMRISQVLCGFDGPMANKLRKAMGKKIKSLMDEMKVKFMDVADKKTQAGEVTIEEVEAIFQQIEAFARYGFNKAHAVAYSAISTVEMWLKYNYKLEYVTALINNTKLGKKKHGYDIFVHYLNYARRSGMDVRGPNISESKSQFTMQGPRGKKFIRFSLAHVKNVANQAPVIESFQPITSIEDFHERVKVTTTGSTGKKSSRRPNKKVVESLVAAGAFDEFGTRNEVMVEYYRCRKNKKDVLPEYTDEEWIEKEREVLGLCLSQPPLYKPYVDLIKENKWLLVSEAQTDDTKKVKVFGQIQSIKPHTSKKGSSMYIVNMTDGLDTMKFFVFQGGQQAFRDNFKVDTIGAVPMSRFDDGGMRFFDDRGKCEVVTTKKTMGGAPVKVKGVTNRRDLFTLTDGSVLMFTDGSTNEWYVSYDTSKTADVTDAHRLSSAEDWLDCVKAMGDEYGSPRVEKDLKEIYDAATKTAEASVLERVREVSETYPSEDSLFVEVIYSWVYATLVAEENLGMPLGKRCQRLAWMQVLEGMKPALAAVWQRKNRAKTEEECVKRGF